MRSVNTDQYLPRISALVEPIEVATNALLPLVPRTPYDNVPDTKAHLILQIVLFASGSLEVCDSLLDHTGTMWSEGRMTAVTPLIRLMLEYWGAMATATDILNEINEGNLEKAGIRSEQLLMGSRSPVLLPWGVPAKVKSIHVMDFVRRAAKEDEDATSLYEFLCEATHPSFFQHFYFYMASKTYNRPGFPSDAYLKHAEELLTKTVVALEKAALGVAREAHRIESQSRDVALAFRG